ncbi:MAG: ferric reductase-like transmembrane domain-containing protein [Anaerolineales bacterium]|nr:ferric reductase-like transmembrane domain-containing protein [Anaerolineales bacterium]
MMEFIKNFFKRYTPFQVAMHIYGWSVLVILIFQYFTNDLTADPVQYLERRTGHHAVALLVMSLACTPLNTLFKWRELIKRRRALGLYGFMYATIHVLIYLHLDFGLAWSFILQNFTQDPRLVVGLIALLLLIPLAWTSFDIWKKRLGKNWKRLHKAVYVIVPLVVLHFAWNKKGNIFTAQGDVAQPLYYGVVVLVLLILRIPRVRKGIVSLRDRIKAQFQKRKLNAETTS